MLGRQLFMCLNLDCFCWVSTLAYPNLFGTYRLCCCCCCIGLSSSLLVLLFAWCDFKILVCLIQAAFRLLVGAGYQTLQSLLLDFCKWIPSPKLLDALLNMLVDGTFDINEKTTIKVRNAMFLEATESLYIYLICFTKLYPLLLHSGILLPDICYLILLYFSSEWRCDYAITKCSAKGPSVPPYFPLCLRARMRCVDTYMCL